MGTDGLLRAERCYLLTHDSMRQPLPLPGSEVCILDGQGIKSYIDLSPVESVVGSAELLPDDARRPAVRHAVMHCQQEDMLLLTDLHVTPNSAVCCMHVASQVPQTGLAYYKGKSSTSKSDDTCRGLSPAFGLLS